MKLSDLKGTFKATATLNSDFCLENKETILADFAAQIEAQGGEWEVKNGNFYIKNSPQFFILPKLAKVRTGTLTFRSRDFEFTWTDTEGKEQTSYGDKPKAKDMLNGGFILTMLNGATITYTLNKEKV